MGSTDVPALTRHETAMTVANSETHDEWLHWDHNPLLPPFDQPMYQSMVYLFPEATGRFGGNTWPRIAMVVCMVPTAYGRDSLSEKTLLALAITGEASNHWPQIGRANYGWAGVRLDEMEATGIKLSPEEIDRRLISTEQLQAHHWQRLFPDLNPDLTHEEIQEFLSHLGIGAEHSTRQDNNHKRVALQSADYKLLRDGLDLPVLRHIVHPGLKTYVRFIAAND